MRLPLVLAAMLLSAASGLAQYGDLRPQIAPTDEQEAEKPASRLVRLDGSLLKAQEYRRQGHIDDKQYQEFLAKFREDLKAAVILVKPTPVNTALHARILSSLGDSEQAPASPALRVALGQIRYDRKDYPAALAEANAVLARDPANKDALALKYSSEGRIGAGGAALSKGTEETPGGAAFEQFRSASARNSLKVQALVARIKDARNRGDMPTAMSLAQELMRTEAATEYTQEIYRIVSKDHARWQRVQMVLGFIESAKAALLAGRGDEALEWANKAVQMDPAPAIKKFAEEVRKVVNDGGLEPTPQKPKPPKNGLPLWPMLPISGLGAAAYVVAKSRKTVESEDGFNDDDRPQPGELQRFVAGSILAGLAGAGLYLGGGMVVSAGAPLAARFMAGPGQQAMRLARSEAGAINPRSVDRIKVTAPQVKAVSEEATEIVREVVIRKGEILNRVWHSEWTNTSNLSGPRGLSYCRGNCLPLGADAAVRNRGLGDVPGVGINNAQRGATYRVTENITAVVRRAIGGIDEEIVIRSSDIDKVKLIQESKSRIPPGH